MKKYQKRKRPPLKSRPAQSVAPAKAGRDSYDKLVLVFTSVAALAAAVSFVIALAGQKSSDQATAAALQRFSQVADAGGRQASQSERIAEATARQASAAQLQAQAALRQADSATKQAASSADQAVTSARSAGASERAIAVAVEQMNQLKLADSNKYRPIIVIKEISPKYGLNENDNSFSITLTNVGQIPAKNVYVELEAKCVFERFTECDDLKKINDDLKKFNVTDDIIIKEEKMEFSFFYI